MVIQESSSAVLKFLLGCKAQGNKFDCRPLFELASSYFDTVTCDRMIMKHI